jgi:hypothetical protein
MSIPLNSKNARLVALTLARVGNSGQNQPLQTSRELCRFEEGDSEILTACFLKPFRALEAHRLHHHADVTKNELHSYACAIFDDNSSLLENGGHIARLLHEKSHHPNIKPGDLCISLVDDLIVEGGRVQGLCIIKSETTAPFLQGIYPDKIDKGCLVLNRRREEGFVVFLFDKSGTGAHFWTRDFAHAMPVKSDDYLTRRYSELAVAFAEKGMPEESPQPKRLEVAKNAIDYLAQAESFDLAEFRERALRQPDLIERFDSFKTEYEEETGAQLDEKFAVSKPEAKKAKKRLKSRLKLDVGVDLKFSSGFIDQSDRFLERGFDEEKHMQYLKVYFHKEA